MLNRFVHVLLGLSLMSSAALGQSAFLAGEASCNRGLEFYAIDLETESIFNLIVARKSGFASKYQDAKMYRFDTPLVTGEFLIDQSNGFLITKSNDGEFLVQRSQRGQPFRGCDRAMLISQEKPSVSYTNLINDYEAFESDPEKALELSKRHDDLAPAAVLPSFDKQSIVTRLENASTSYWHSYFNERVDRWTQSMFENQQELDNLYYEISTIFDPRIGAGYKQLAYNKDFVSLQTNLLLNIGKRADLAGLIAKPLSDFSKDVDRCSLVSAADWATTEIVFGLPVTFWSPQVASNLVSQLKACNNTETGEVAQLIERNYNSKIVSFGQRWERDRERVAERSLSEIGSIEKRITELQELEVTEEEVFETRGFEQFLNRPSVQLRLNNSQISNPQFSNAVFETQQRYLALHASKTNEIYSLLEQLENAIKDLIKIEPSNLQSESFSFSSYIQNNCNVPHYRRVARLQEKLQVICKSYLIEAKNTWLRNIINDRISQISAAKINMETYQEIAKSLDYVPNIDVPIEAETNAVLDRWTEVREAAAPQLTSIEDKIISEIPTSLIIVDEQLLADEFTFESFFRSFCGRNDLRGSSRRVLTALELECKSYIEQAKIRQSELIIARERDRCDQQLADLDVSQNLAEQTVEVNINANGGPISSTTVRQMVCLMSQKGTVEIESSGWFTKTHQFKYTVDNRNAQSALARKMQSQLESAISNQRIMSAEELIFSALADIPLATELPEATVIFTLEYDKDFEKWMIGSMKHSKLGEITNADTGKKSVCALHPASKLCNGS